MADSANVPSDSPPDYTQVAAEHPRGSVPQRAASVRRPLQPLDLPIIGHLNSKRVVLASASPRRKALLQQVKDPLPVFSDIRSIYPPYQTNGGIGWSQQPGNHTVDQARGPG